MTMPSPATWAPADDGDQRLGRLTVGKEVVDDQHPVVGRQMHGRDGYGALGLLGKGIDTGDQ